MRDDKDSTEAKEEKEPRSPVEGWPRVGRGKPKEKPSTGPVDTANPEPAEEKASRTSRPRSANVRHTQRGRFSVDGPSGTRYAFGSHGVLKVKGEDVEALLAIKRVQRTCCGPRAPQVLYPLVLA